MKFFFSMSLAGSLLLVFGVTIGVATFIENDFGAASAQALVYKALWFELLLTFMVINMLGIIVQRKLYLREKWGSLLFHSAFIIILIGAGITRFTGQEGLMHIREGEVATSFLTDETYISGVVLEGDEKQEFSKKVLFVPIKKSAFSTEITLGGKETSITLIKHIPNAKEIVENNPQEGEPILTVVTAGGGGGREDHYLRLGQVLNLGAIVIGFESETPVAVNIKLDSAGLKMISSVPVSTFSMDTQAKGVIEVDSIADAPFRHLLSVGPVNFVLSAFDPMGQVMLVSKPGGSKQGTIDALVFSIKQGGEEAEVVIMGGKGMEGTSKFASVGDANIMISYGSKKIEVPFGIELVDFQLDRYPGSNSPSSYASEVNVKDGETEFPFRIYMNNILSYKGYRLYQSSYDRDELGTVLSINKDKPGTYVSYFGYLVLAIGLLYILFNKNSRFTELSEKIDKVHAKRASLSVLLALMLFVSPALYAQEEPDFTPTVAQADSLANLIYQTNDGRMAPLHSLAGDLLRKVYQSTSYNGLTPSQVLLGMMATPYTWQAKPIIQVKNEVVQGMLGTVGKYASYNDFFSKEGKYKLADVIGVAYEKKPSERSQLDKDLMKVDERINISFMMYRGDLLKIFPVPSDSANRWVSPSADDFISITGKDSIFVRNSFHQYVVSLVKGDQDQAELFLNGIKRYQKKFGADVLPSKSKIKLEIKFNELNIFERLFPYYLVTGFFLLIITFIKIFKPKTKFKYLVISGQVLIIIGFIVHTLGLALRWYVSGHEPWSNGYESMIYIAWATMLAGLLFSRKSEMTLSVTAILSAVILMVAHLSWMDPEITNLVPVLKSYWLTIHVATIVASYGFLGLGALLAFVNLLSYIFKRKSNLESLNLSITELTYVIEMTLTFGLILLTIGNFLGGIWANESWGRYWGWDPKETWALASIIFYSFVLHMRFIPGLQSKYAFNLASVITFASILMTYFGVNFYLSGLHSYAAGDPVPIPTFVYYTVAIVGVIALWAFFNNERFKTKSIENDN